MGNLCSIFHSRFKNLIKIIPSARKAQLMDYLLLGWQTSTYKLKGSNEKWFMKPYAEIVVETGIPPSSLQRYLKELSDDGFIVRRQALYGRTKESQGFEVKKGAYIYITDKFLQIVKPVVINPVSTDEGPINPSEEKTPHQINASQNEEPKESSNFDNNESFETLKMRGLYIRDLYSFSFSFNNIINNNLTGVDKAKQKRLVHQFQAVNTLLFSEIKEEIPDLVKKLISGTFFNLIFKHHVELSSPKQMVSEYLYALLNIEFYLPNVKCFKHRNNILSKLLRAKAWRTPKGFYNHFYLGEQFKDKNKLHEERWKREKQDEIECKTTVYYEPSKDERLKSLEEQMLIKSTLIEKLNERLYQVSSEQNTSKIRENIELARCDLDRLWAEQLILEQELEFKLQESGKLCA